MKRKLLVGLMVLVMSVLWTGIGLALAPSAGTVTSWSDKPVGPGPVRLFQISYVTHSSTGTFTCSTSRDITGWILLVETDPGATAPTSYGITLVNTNDRDVMGGALAGRSTTLTEAVMPLQDGNYTPVFVDGVLVVTVTSAGNSRTMEILIYYLP